MEKKIDHILEPLFLWWNGFGTLTAPCDFEDAGKESKSRLRELLADHMEKEPCADLIAYNAEIFAAGSRVYDAQSVDWKIEELNARHTAELAELEELADDWQGVCNDTIVDSEHHEGYQRGKQQCVDELAAIVDKHKGKDSQSDGYYQIQECGGCGEMYIISLIEACGVCDQLLCTDCLPREKHGCWEETDDANDKRKGADNVV